MAIDVEIYSHDILIPAEMDLDTPGGGVEAGRSFAASSLTVDFAGGGIWSAKFQGTIYKPYQHLYWNQLRYILNNRTISIAVPLITDYIVPTTEIGGPLYLYTPHSDTTPFSDTSLYSQPSVLAWMTVDQTMSDSTISITVKNGRSLFRGETFSIDHTTKRHRAYGVKDIDSFSVNSDGSTTYIIGIHRPLYEDVAALTELRFVRPLQMMRIAPGTTLNWHAIKYWKTQFNVSFIEA